uniref:Uncharacterized protein n=1 Tax=Rousettus bat poxvirus TaxID=3141933 RepID=A0AAU7E228_9POXV
MVPSDVEDVLVHNKHRLLRLRDRLDQQAFYVDDVYRMVQENRLGDVHAHRAALREILTVRDYAAALAMTPITEREFEDLYDLLAFSARDPTLAPNSVVVKEACRVLAGLFCQGCAREDYYEGWVRKIRPVLARHPALTKALARHVLACLTKP